MVGMENVEADGTAVSAARINTAPTSGIQATFFGGGTHSFGIISPLSSGMGAWSATPQLLRQQMPAS